MKRILFALLLLCGAIQVKAQVDTLRGSLAGSAPSRVDSLWLRALLLGKLNVSASPAASVNGQEYVNVSSYVSPIPTDSSNASWIGTDAFADYSGTAHISGNVTGLRARGQIESGWANIVEAIDARAIWNSTNTMAGQSLYGVRSYIENTAVGTVSHAMAFKANSPVNSGGGTIQNNWGFYIADQRGVSANSSAIHIEQSGAGNSIDFGNGSSNKYAQIWSRTQNEIQLNPWGDYTITIRSKLGDATTIAFDAMDSTASSWKQLSMDAASISFNTLTTGKVTIGGNMNVVGNVGIGVVTPFATLHVQGGIMVASAANGGGFLSRNAADNGNVTMFYLDGSDNMVIKGATGVIYAANGTSAYQLQLYNVNTQTVELNSAGDSYLNGGKLTVGGSYTSSAPNGGTAAAWKLGTVVTTTGLLPSTTTYIQVDVGGTLYKLATIP